MRGHVSITLLSDDEVETDEEEEERSLDLGTFRNEIFSRYLQGSVINQLTGRRLYIVISSLVRLEEYRSR